MFVVQPSVNIKAKETSLTDHVSASGSGRISGVPRRNQAQRDTARPEFKLPSAIERAATAAAPGMERLASAMASLGMNPSGLDIKYSEELVWYPGGSYVNRLITVTSGSRSERFSAELTARNPMVTAYEIQKYLSVPGINSRSEA